MLQMEIPTLVLTLAQIKTCYLKINADFELKLQTFQFSAQIICGLSQISALFKVDQFVQTHSFGKFRIHYVSQNCSIGSLSMHCIFLGSCLLSLFKPCSARWLLLCQVSDFYKSCEYTCTSHIVHIYSFESKSEAMSQVSPG